MGHETKDAFVKRVHAQLDELQAEISTREDNIDTVASSEREKSRQLLEQMKSKLNKVQSQLIDLQSDTDKLWHDARIDVETAMDELENVMGKAVAETKPR
jgi:septal ring factor EnvC (AmiA/AmiB activator)